MRTFIKAMAAGAVLMALLSSCSESAVTGSASAESTPMVETVSEAAETAPAETISEAPERAAVETEAEAPENTQAEKAEVAVVSMVNCSEKTVTGIHTVTESGEEIIDGKTVPDGENIEMRVPVGVPYTATFSFDNGDAFEIKDTAPEEIAGKNLYITNGAYIISDELTDVEATAETAEQPAEMPAETEYDPNDGCIGDEGLFW